MDYVRPSSHSGTVGTPGVRHSSPDPGACRMTRRSVRSSGRDVRSDRPMKGCLSCWVVGHEPGVEGEPPRTPGVCSWPTRGSRGFTLRPRRPGVRRETPMSRNGNGRSGTSCPVGFRSFGFPEVKRPSGNTRPSSPPQTTSNRLPAIQGLPTQRGDCVSPSLHTSEPLIV